MGSALLPLIRDRIAILLETGELTVWQEARFTEWRELSFGSPRQNEVVDEAGRRIYGDKGWLDYARGLTAAPTRR